MKQDRIDGISLAEMHSALKLFGVDVTIGALRQVLRELDIEPLNMALGRSGRGRTYYYDYVVLWLLATAYHAAYGPKTKFATIGKRLKEAELSRPERFSISEHFVDENHPVPQPQRDHKWLRQVYLGYVTDPSEGLGLRVLTDVARKHGHETGLDDDEIKKTLLNYVRDTLTRIGVPTDAAKKVSLD